MVGICILVEHETLAENVSKIASNSSWNFFLLGICEYLSRCQEVWSLDSFVCCSRSAVREASACLGCGQVLPSNLPDKWLASRSLGAELDSPLLHT